MPQRRGNVGTTKKTSACLLLAIVCGGCHAAPTQGAEGPSARPEPPPVDSAARPAPMIEAGAASAPSRRAVVHCFSWVHGPDASTDCYRTREACEAERRRTEEGARPATPCERREGTSCTLVSRPPSAPAPLERCFGDAAACGRYRAFVTRSGHVTTPCDGG